MDLGMLKQLAIGALPPVVAAWIAMLLVWRGRRIDGEAADGGAWRRAAVPVLLAIITIGVHVLVFGAPEWPVRRALDTLVGTAVAAGAAGALVAWRRPGWAKVLALGSLVTLFGAWAAAWGPMSTWTAGQAALRLGLAGLVGGVNAAAAERIAMSVPGRAGLVSVMLGVAGAAQVLATGFFSLKLGQAAGIGAACLAGALGASLTLPGRAGWNGVGFVPVVMAAVCVFQGWFAGGSERPSLLAGLCAAALPAGAAVTLVVPERWSAVRRGACVMLGIVIPLGLAVVLGAFDWLEANKDY